MSRSTPAPSSQTNSAASTSPSSGSPQGSPGNRTPKGSSTTAPSGSAATASDGTGADKAHSTTSRSDGGVAISPARFKVQFAPARSGLHVLGEQLATVLRRAARESDAVLTLELRGLSARALRLSSQIDHLHPPRSYTPDVKALAVNLGSVGDDLSNLAGAASANSSSRAREATRQLVEHSLRVKAAEISLVRKLGPPN